MRITILALILTTALATAQEKPDGKDATLERLTVALTESAAKLKANPDSHDAARENATRISELAGYLARRGQKSDTEGALALMKTSLKLREQLMKALPLELPIMRDLSVALNELGDLLARRGQPGDAEEALAHFTRSLEYSEGVYKTTPDSAAAGRDVAVSLDKLGVFYARRGDEGDGEKALAHFTRALELSTKFHTAKPDSLDEKRDMAVSHERLGALLADSEREKALEHYKTSLQLREELMKAAPESSDALRDVSVILEKLGEFLARHGQPSDAEKTLTLFERCVEIREDVMRQFPLSGQAARDLSVGLNKLGDYLTGLGRPGDADQALKHFTRDLEISEKLLKANSGSQQAVRDVVVSHYKLAGFAQKRGDAKSEETHGKAIVETLKERIAHGMEFDAPLMELFETLKEKFDAK